MTGSGHDVQQRSQTDTYSTTYNCSLFSVLLSVYEVTLQRPLCV